MNCSPILYCVATQIRDFETLMSFMMVCKTTLRVVKHLIRNTPTVFIPIIWYETRQMFNYKQYMFDSIQELFIKMHKHYLEDPTFYTAIQTGKKFPDENHAGPCYDCLKNHTADWESCNCNDISYEGIKIVKYVHSKKPLYNNNTWRPTLIPFTLGNGFRMSQILELPYNTTSINRNSFQYLYNGLTPVNIKDKLGIKTFKNPKFHHKIYYPVTNDDINRFYYLYEQKTFTGNESIYFYKYLKTSYKNTI